MIFARPDDGAPPGSDGLGECLQAVTERRQEGNRNVISVIELIETDNLVDQDLDVPGELLLDERPDPGSVLAGNRLCELVQNAVFNATGSKV